MKFKQNISSRYIVDRIIAHDNNNVVEEKKKPNPNITIISVYHFFLLSLLPNQLCRHLEQLYHTWVSEFRKRKRATKLDFRKKMAMSCLLWEHFYFVYTVEPFASMATVQAC